MSSTDDSPSYGMFWIYAGLLVGAGLSLYANIKYTFIPPHAAPPWWPAGRPWNPAGYSPPNGALVLAASWPVLLYITTEVMIWKGWLAGKGWALVRGLSMLLVAAPVANASYHHLSGLLAYYFPDDVLTVRLGPLAIDGATLMCTAALQSKAQRRRLQRQAAAMGLPGVGGFPSPVNPPTDFTTPRVLTGDRRPSPATLTGGTGPEDASPVVGAGVTSEAGTAAPSSSAAFTGEAGRSPVSSVGEPALAGAGNEGQAASAVGVFPLRPGDIPLGGITGEGAGFSPTRRPVVTGEDAAAPVGQAGEAGLGVVSPVILTGEARASRPAAKAFADVPGDAAAPPLGSPVRTTPLTGEHRLPSAGDPELAKGLSDRQVADLAVWLKPDGLFSAKWLVDTFRIGTGRATRIFQNHLAPEAVAAAARQGVGSADVEAEALAEQHPGPW